MIALLSLPAFGMGFTSSDEVVAFSDDGRSALVDRASSGPEGGGMDAYWIVTLGPAGTGAGPTSVRFDVSNDASPGNGETPERIPVEACRKAVGDLAAALANLRFTGVHAEPAKCRTANRPVLTVDEGHHAGAGGAKVDGKADAKVVVGDASFALHLPADEVSVYAATSPKLVLVVHSDEYGRLLTQALEVGDKGLVAVQVPL